MKALFSILLLALMLIQVSYRPAVVLSWKIGQERITRKYCINKDRPAMHCDGKCYLAKQLRKLDLAEQRERSHNTLPEQKLKQADLLFVGILPDYGQKLSSRISGIERSAPLSRTVDYRFEYLKFCFHPPEI